MTELKDSVLVPERELDLSEAVESEVESNLNGKSPSLAEVMKPVTIEELKAFKAKQERAGIIYISRIPPAMRPSKVRHLMSQYGSVGRIYLQQEDPKRAYLRRKHTSTKKAHFTEGWVEFEDKRVARSVAEMLNAQPIGGKKGTRFRDDIWTMKYLPRFKWSMLTEHIAHEAAVHREKLRVELSQSRHEQNDYLRQVELKRVLDKRSERKRKREEETGEHDEQVLGISIERLGEGGKTFSDRDVRATARKKSERTRADNDRGIAEAAPQTAQLDSVLDAIF